jgi:hypothetical protein
MWKNKAEPDSPQMIIQTRTFGIYNTYCFSTVTMVALMRLNVMLNITLPVLLADEGKCALIKYPNCIILISEISSSWPHFWMLHLRIALQPMADDIDPVSLATK